MMLVSLRTARYALARAESGQRLLHSDKRKAILMVEVGGRKKGSRDGTTLWI